MAEPHDGGGYLVDVSADSSKQPVYVLTTCPICETQLFDDITDCKHTHVNKIAEHIATHEPDDLDLDGPYCYTPMADILINNHGLKKGR